MQKAAGAIIFRCIIIAFHVMCFCCLTYSNVARATLLSLNDDELERISGQALFITNKTSADLVAGEPAADTGLTFYRIGLDSQIAFNANIQRLQLGCGGINNSISKGCDVDLQNVAFLGTDGAGGAGPAVTSDFTLIRPYIELAIANDGSPNRQIVGFNLGAQGAKGYLSVGSVLSNGEVNPNGGTCNTASTSPLACNTGINSLSGSINAHVQGSLPICIQVIVCISATGNFDTTLQVSGTRMASINAPSLKLNISQSILDLIGLTSAYADLTENLRFLHGFAISNSDGSPTSDFGISFQKQQVAYPTFSGTGFEPTTNAGWWFNVPSAQLTNISAPLVTLNIVQALTALAPPGAAISDVSLGQVPAHNCYGSYKFC